jgi:hypothetical protein
MKQWHIKLLIPVLLLSFFLLVISDASESQDACSSSATNVLLQVGHSPVERAFLTDPAGTINICTAQDNMCADMILHQLSFDDSVTSQSSPQDRNPRASKFVQQHLLNNDVEIIVTRFEEDIRWLDALEAVPTTVYNRGPRNNLMPKPRSNLLILDQVNRGREDQVMLNHIVQRYDLLPEVTIFLQGWPFGHCPGLVDSLGDILLKFFNQEVQMGSKQAKVSFFDHGHAGLVPLSTTFWQYSISDGRLGLASEIFESHHQTQDTVPAVVYARSLYTDTCEMILGRPCPDIQWVAEGSQWAVTRERIHCQPKEVYERVLSLGEGFESKYRGLVLEALWPLLWSNDAQRSIPWDPTNATELEFDEDSQSASKRAHSLFHCRDPRSAKLGVLWSCYDRIGVCEFNKQTKPNMAHLRRRHNLDFMDVRKVFQIDDPTNDTKWSMTIVLKPVLGGASTFAPLVAPHSYFHPTIVELVPGSGQLQVPPVSDQNMDPLQFIITESSDGVDRERYLFRLSSSPMTAPRYLGCNNETNNAELVLRPYRWSIDFIWDGFSQLNSKLGQLSLRREDAGHLKCLPATAEQLHSNSFLLSGVMHTYS